ncbi:hypothetical protein GGE61_004651 [Rhizobium leguminosarum]|nr:hypothetical protein [Rhizobium leguminosarum]
MHYARILTTWKTLFVHCSYVNAAALPKSADGGQANGVRPQAASEWAKPSSRATAANA